MDPSRFGACRVAPTASVLAVALVAALAGCGGSSTSSTTTSTTSSTTTSSSPAPSATVSTGSVSGLGTVLVDSQGRTLYIFEPDKHARVTCTGSCTQVWPPLKLASGRPSASGAAKSSLLGSDPNPEGGRVATYAGWPLYTYVGDSGPGNASGQGLNTNGGLWYAIAPSGRPVTATP
jgi:predicted lipoprotein with Yx(FWY)xxD motif